MTNLAKKHPELVELVRSIHQQRMDCAGDFAEYHAWENASELFEVFLMGDYDALMEGFVIDREGHY